MNKKRIAIGLDVGGMSIKGLVLDSDGNKIAWIRHVCPEDWKWDEDKLQDLPKSIIEAADKALAESGLSLDEISGIGIGVPNPILPNGHLQNIAPGPQTWSDYDLAGRIKEHFPGVRVSFANDAHAAALGEAHYGAGSPTGTFSIATLGTGVGGATIVDGKIFMGGVGVAGTLGHVIIMADGGKDCVCGAKGCLETLCSHDAIVNRYAELTGTNVKDVDVKNMVAEARAGGKEAKQVFQEAGYYLGIALKNMNDLIAPDFILVCGGIGEAGDLILDPARKVISEWAFSPASKKVPIIKAKLGNEAGAYGAAALILKYDESDSI